MGREVSQFIRQNKDRPFFVNYWAFTPHAPLFLALQAFDRAGPLAVGGGIFRLALEYPIPLSRRGDNDFQAL
jgi:hypothetical protein